MEIDDRKFAAFIRYYGRKAFEEGDEDAYIRYPFEGMGTDSKDYSSSSCGHFASGWC
jgi:hypothetical protein